MDGRGVSGAHAVPARNTGTSAVTAEGVSLQATWSQWHRGLLWASVATGALTHGYHLFEYPLYITDEGIYMEQAWSVLRQGSLSPYTYFYDHAPAGWLMIAGWVALLPRRFETFGDAINSGRALMLLAHIAS